MHWLEENRLVLGVLADSLTFLGGLILARDALNRLGELKKKRDDEEFRKNFALLNLTDNEWQHAVVSVRWALAGFVFVVLGFLAQLLLRLAEAVKASRAG
jgi:hypothetical protein